MLDRSISPWYIFRCVRIFNAEKICTDSFFEVNFFFKVYMVFHTVVFLQERQNFSGFFSIFRDLLLFSCRVLTLTIEMDPKITRRIRNDKKLSSGSHIF